MNDVNREEQKAQELALACSLTNKLFDAEQSKPVIYLEPTSSVSDAAVSDRWQRVNNSKGHLKNMRWKDIYRKQQRSPNKFMCTVKDSVTKEIVGFISGKYSEGDTDGSRISIDYVERSNTSRRAKGYIIDIAMKLAYVLGFAKRCTHVKVNNPVYDLIKYYQDEMPESKLVKHKQSSYLIAAIDHKLVLEQLEGFLPDNN
ncbi:hypothetical protein HJ030_21110 [Vibrio parahaemolyticus]|uniref:hypothetical protein n=1 Tax=Vibrio parahaemolyticus TaxID=670 RepID=UPI00186A5DE5|nr:hypothetical protein [Vibrio parahaemolyticus]EHR6713957.1 hypothetical protein [Vibrio parahaemolyticus]MBE4385636.1 hypothetical protein [Vibrio parahaemolyticus]HCE1969744.1 hypothetical protein [Vibrio parahaemolyticus]HCG8413936.1 hypothetical protein [Vibrio parahaemolyticus]